MKASLKDVWALLQSFHLCTVSHAACGTLQLHLTMSCGLHGDYSHVLWEITLWQAEKGRSIRSQWGKSDVTKAERPLRANHSAGQTDRRETQSPACFWLIVTDGVGAECVRCSGLSSTNVLVSTDRCTFMCTAECSKNVSLLLFLCLTLTHKHKHCIWRSSRAEKDFQRQWQRPLKCEKCLKLRIVLHLSIYALCFLCTLSSIFDSGDLGG